MQKNKSGKVESSPGESQRENSTVREIRNYLLKKGIWYTKTEEEIIREFAELGEQNAT